MGLGLRGELEVRAVAVLATEADHAADAVEAWQLQVTAKARSCSDVRVQWLGLRMLHVTDLLRYPHLRASAPVLLHQPHGEGPALDGLQTCRESSHEGQLFLGLQGVLGCGGFKEGVRSRI